MKRVEESVKEALMEIIQRRLKDPRIPMIFSLTSVTVSRDLQEAQVRFSQIPDDEDAIENTLDVLEGASGYIRRELANAVRMRFTPALHFHFDPGNRNAQRIETILADWRQELSSRPPAPADGEESSAPPK